MPVDPVTRRAHRLARQAARRLPSSARATYEQTWRAEMDCMDTPRERLTYARDLKAGLREIRRELDPEGAFVGDIVRGVSAVSLTLLLLAGFGVSPEWLKFLAHTLMYGFVVLLLSHLTAKCVLILPEVRRVWWRLVLITLLGLFCAFWDLAFLTWWSASHPQAFLLLVCGVVLGVQIARRFHVPRPPLAR